MKLRKDAPLVVEEEPSLYFYRLRMGSHEQIGVVGCYSIDDYDQDLIKKHERTRRDKEDDRTRHIVSLRAQTGPVFLTYRASNEIDNEATRQKQQLKAISAVVPYRGTSYEMDNRDHFLEMGGKSKEE